MKTQKLFTVAASGSTGSATPVAAIRVGDFVAFRDIEDTERQGFVTDIEPSLAAIWVQLGDEGNDFPQCHELGGTTVTLLDR